MPKIVIAIDGYSSCGKSTTAKAVAARMGYGYIDTGAMYRAVSLFFIQERVSLASHRDVVAALEKIHITFSHNNRTGKNETCLNGLNVEEEIRKMYISNIVSEVSAIPEVRWAMVAQQQKMGRRRGVVMDGRDIGTKVFPDAEVKVFMTADTQNEGFGLSLNLANAGLSYDHASEKSSISATGYYGNLKPLFTLVRQNTDWTHVPEFAGSSLTYRLQPSKTGLFKFYGMYSDSRMELNFFDPSNDAGKTVFNQRNRNFFTTSTYTDSWSEGRWLLNSGVSYSYDTDATTFDVYDFGRSGERLQGRAVLTRLLPKNNSFLFGTEVSRVTTRNAVAGTNYTLHDNYGAVFVESQTYLGRNLALQLGLRGEYSSVINRFNLAPRVSMAYKTGMFSQVSLAYGQFYQTPDYRYVYRNTNLNYERADHLILNYQIIKNKRTFRVETFYKNYAQLVREFTGQPGTPDRYDANPYRFPIGTTNNSGYGYAQGFDIFWRDQKTIKGLDYWVTYSYVDSKRLFQQYLVSATPTFISNHNISLIGKRYFEKISTNMVLTYTISSGRPYYNPNNDVFLADRTPMVNNLSFSASHITRIRKNMVILYTSVDNILNTHNVFTYRYTPDGKTRYAVGPQSYRSFFVGGMIMLSRKAKVNVNDL